MELVTQKSVHAYLEQDRISAWMRELSQADDWQWTCQRWLADSEPKRYIFDRLYGDLLTSDTTRTRVLDVGGGLTCFTTLLAKKHDYHLADLCAHEGPGAATRVNDRLGRCFVHETDWSGYGGENFDLVLANDIFPNVDQRIEAFLERYLPRCRSMRLSLTWYNTPRAYQVQRIDGDEILFMLAWDGDQLQRVLNKFSAEIVNYDEEIFSTSQPSLYPNGRQVCLVELTGRAGR